MVMVVVAYGRCVVSDGVVVAVLRSAAVKSLYARQVSQPVEQKSKGRFEVHTHCVRSTPAAHPIPSPTSRPPFVYPSLLMCVTISLGRCGRL